MTKENEDKLIKEWLEEDRKLSIKESEYKQRRIDLFFRIKEEFDEEENKKIKELENKKNFKCDNCGEEDVEHKGDWCDNCNLPERSAIK